MLRISTIARLIEDTTIAAASNVALRTKNVVHRTKLEYRARQMAALKVEVEKADRALTNMSADEKAKFKIEQQLIRERANQIASKKLGTRRYGPRVQQPAAKPVKAPAAAKAKRNGK